MDLKSYLLKSFLINLVKQNRNIAFLFTKPLTFNLKKTVYCDNRVYI